MKMQADKGLLGQYAGFFTRLLAFLLDVVIVIAATLLVSVTVDSLLGVLGIDLRKCADVTRGTPLRFAACVVATRSLPVIQVSIIPLYYVVFWSLSGQTPGKAALGVRVVRINGKRMGLVTASVRYVGYVVSMLALGLGFFWILVDDRRQGWHDKMARTCVIYSWDARTDEYFLWRVVKWVRRRWG
jgi:uncharacterized RDD family membrane protein YckC